jgi:hypothetical protein
LNDNDKTKGELLLKYSQKDPTEFFQFDAFTTDFDDVVHPCDDSGVALMGNTTVELMHGAAVRILIRHDTTHEDALKALECLVDWIRADRCKRCGGQWGYHHAACRDESLPDAEVKTIAKWDARPVSADETPF